MGVLADLVKKAQPALIGDGCQASATEGASWQWKFTDILNDAGTAINLTTVTGTCTIYSGGATVTTLTFAGASDGTFTLTKDESATVGLAAGADTLGRRRCAWGLTMSDGTDVVQAWGPTNSTFLILKSSV